MSISYSVVYTVGTICNWIVIGQCVTSRIDSISNCTCSVKVKMLHYKLEIINWNNAYWQCLSCFFSGFVKCDQANSCLAKYMKGFLLQFKQLTIIQVFVFSFSNIAKINVPSKFSKIKIIFFEQFVDVSNPKGCKNLINCQHTNVFWMLQEITVSVQLEKCWKSTLVCRKVVLKSSTMAAITTELDQ